ncbi:MAG: GPI anchored serine-threonine rich family protein [Candidatus Sumerlaeia bacterium]|nr:GPI anchored serine-threonine rich family protein [Candidatus Sumerlaeia bacterium]
MIVPKGGELWKRGTTREIRWGAANTLGQGSVKIELYNGTTLHSTIAASTANDGAHSWMIPLSIPWSSNYRIKISRVGTASEFVFSAPFEIHPDPSITVVTPNGGQSWQRGTTRYIVWSWAGYPGPQVRIELLKGGVVNRTIATNTPNDGMHPWAIPFDQALGTDYRIRIRSATTASIFDESNAQFSIVDPILTVLRPLPGDWWMHNRTYDIVWKWTGTPPALSQIELVQGSNTFLITNKASNAPQPDGTCRYAWTIPTTIPLASNYKIRITGVGGQGISDSSEDFRIVAQESLNLTSPNGGEFWLRGTTHEIKWVSTLTQPAQVKIELYKGGSFHSVITAATDNDGSHTWSIPATQPLGSDYRVRIQLTSPTTVYDFTNTTFRIAAPQIVVLWPQAKAVLTPGVSQLLQWQSSDIPVRNPHVRIELWRGGVFDLLITSSTADTGSYQWRIPPNIPPGPHFQIRISSVEDPSIEGFSEEQFALANLPAVQLLTPNGSERVQRGSLQVISWRYNGLPNTDARVELYRSGQLVDQIARVMMADGSVRWAVPRSLPSGRDYKIKITSLFDPTVFDWSDGFFFIEPDAAVNGARWTLY